MNRIHGYLLTCSILAAAAACPAAEQETADQPGLDLYYNANALCNRGLYRQAISEYETFLKKHPAHEKAPDAKWATAVCYYNLGNPKQAVSLLTKLADGAEGSRRVQIGVLLGSCLLDLKKYAEAEKALRDAVQKAQKPKAAIITQARAALVEALFMQKQWKDLKAAADTALKAVPDSVYSDRIEYQRAVAAFYLEQYAEAEKAFKQTIDGKADPAMLHRARFRRGECLRELGKLKEAAASFSAAAATEGVYRKYAVYNLGVVRFLQKDHDAAIQVLAGFRQKYGDGRLADHADYYRARALLKKGQDDGAEKVLTGLLSHEVLGSKAALWLARSTVARGDHQKAVELLANIEKRFSKTPEYVDLLAERGSARMSLEQYEEAAADFGTARTRAPEKEAADLLRLEAFCLYNGEQYDDCLDRCGAFLKKYGTNENVPEIIFLKSEAFYAMGKGDEAFAAFNGFLKAHPDSEHAPVARYHRAKLLADKKKWAAALADLQKLPDDMDDRAEFRQLHFRRGNCYLNLEKHAEAIGEYRTFTDEHPLARNADTALFNRAVACDRENKRAEAIETLQKLVYELYGNAGDNKPHPDILKKTHLSMARMELGRLLLEANKLDDSLEVLNEAVADKEHFTDDGRAEYYRGWIKLKQGAESAAASFFTRAAKHANMDFAVDAALQAAILNIREKQYGEAERLLKQAAAADADAAKPDMVAYYLALSLARREKYKDALTHFETVLKKYPKSEKSMLSLYWKGRCQEEVEKDGAAKAAATYRTFLEKYPDDELTPTVRLELARLDYTDKKYDAVIASAERIVKTAGEKTIAPRLRKQALYLIGWAAKKTKQFQRSAEAFEKIPAIEGGEKPDYASIFQAGEARMKLKEYEAARRHFDLAAKKGTPELRAKALLRRSECEGMLDEWKASEQSCRLFLEDFPGDPLTCRAHFKLGWALENQNRCDEAVTAYRKVMARKKNDELSARSQFQIGECLYAQKKYDRAIVELTRVVSGYDFPAWSARAILETGRILQAQDKEKEAMDSYREVIDKYPKSDEATAAKKLLRKLQ